MAKPCETTGAQRKAKALERHEGNHADLLELARKLARIEAMKRNGRQITADHVRLAFEKLRPGQWGNWAGSIFRGKEWRVAGFTESTIPSNHARVTRIWEYRG